MGQSVGSMNFVLASKYDNAGVAAATYGMKDLEKAVGKLGLPFDELKNKAELVDAKLKDIGASRDMIRGMSSAAPHTNVLMAKLGDSNNATIQAERADNASKVAMLAADKNYWTERAKMRDFDLKDQIQADQIAAQQSKVQAAQVANADKAYWLERARMRDMDVQKQIQADQLSNASKMAAIAEEKTARTNMILSTVREQQAVAMQNNRWMFGQSNAQQVQAATGGTGKGFGGAMAASQIGYMIQDASSQMTNAKTAAEGWARAIPAVANNVQMLGSAFGPMGLAVTAIGGGLAGAILPAVIRWASGTDELNRKLEETEDRYDRIGEAMTNASRANMEAASKLSPDVFKEDAERRTKEAEQAFRNADKDVLRLNAQKKQLDQELAKQQSQSAYGSTVGSLLPASADLRDRMQTNKDQLEQAKEVRDQAQIELNAMNNTLVAARKASDQKELADKGDALKKQFDLETNQAKAIAEFKQQSAERYGDEQSKLIAKQAREEKELREKIGEGPGADAALAQLNRQQQIDRNKLDLDTEIKARRGTIEANSDKITELEQLGTHASGSSSASVRGTGAATAAVSRAISGTGSKEDDRRAEVNELKKLNANTEKLIKQIEWRKVSLGG